MSSNTKISCLDFFAGSGLVTRGLKDHFEAVWANDVCERKARIYLANHPGANFHLGPIEQVSGGDLPPALLSWGSFPCQDLSLAGRTGGLSGKRSGLAWQWLRVMDEMPQRPPLVAAENVAGLASASGGKNYRALHDALVERGFKVGAFMLDAANWLPQSRRRVFVVAVPNEIDSSEYESNAPGYGHNGAILKAAEGLGRWVFWRLPPPRARRPSLEDLIDWNAPRHGEDKTSALMDMIPPRHREKMIEAMARGYRVFPGYKRTRKGGQVLELRFDGLAGCLRTPEGGSSRQYLVMVEDGRFSTRLITVGEAALLMGAGASYKIPGGYNDGYRAMGDAVAVPVTRYLARVLLAPLAGAISRQRKS